MALKVLFIQTGGTIDKDYPRLTEGYAFEISEPAVRRILAKVSPYFEYEVVSALKKDSQEITAADRKKLYNICKTAKAAKIIITHGTDTMIKTGKALASIKGKTIVLTGAMRPEMFSNSDASFNVGLALGALGSAPNGVYIAMNGRVYPISKVKRNLKTGQFVG